MCHIWGWNKIDTKCMWVCNQWSQAYSGQSEVSSWKDEDMSSWSESKLLKDLYIVSAYEKSLFVLLTKMKVNNFFLFTDHSIINVNKLYKSIYELIELRLQIQCL